MSQESAKSVCTSTIVVSANLLYPTASTSSAVRAPENAEEDPDTPQQADGDIQMEYN
jgi:hypothetical protein